MPPDASRFTFPRSRRLSGQRVFAAVYGARVRKHAGPLVVYGRPNELGFTRLGLSVSRRVGIAVRRNRIKRLLREAFRLNQHDWPRGYDLVVSVRPHEAMPRDEYERWLSAAVRAMDKAWRKKRGE